MSSEIWDRAAFLLFQFPAHQASCHFHCAGFSSRSASTIWAFTESGFCCVWPPPLGGQAKVVSARLNLRNSTRDIRECVIFLVLSCHSKNLKQQTSVTDQLQLSFIWQAKENTFSRHEGNTKEVKRREAQFCLLCLYAFSPPLSLPYVKWASQEVFLLHLMFSIQSSDLPLFYFHGLFPFFAL